ncbi:MAG: glycosyltransferase family 4 protein [Clostridia bacterium]|nr:glycosyltransferase family 4 protein [Clostridia bacterium]
MQKVLFTATVDSHIKHFHLPYLKWFQEQGYEVHVATNGEEEIPYCNKKHIVRFERSPFKTNNLKAIKQLKKIIEKEKFDIIHCHTPMGSVVTRIAAMKAREKYHTKVIYTAHGFHFFKGAPIINWLIYYPVEKMLDRAMDCLITINEEDYNLAKRRFKTKQIELVHGVGVDETRFNITMTEQEKAELRRSLGIEENDFVIIYPAELNKNKNQGMLLNAITKLKKQGYENIKVLLPGKDSNNGAYEIMAKNLEIEQQIKFLGYRTDIPKLIKISNLAVATSKREGLPINMVEAMYCELPCIATINRGHKELIESGRNGFLIEINNVNQLASNILELYKNKELRIEFTKNAKEKAEVFILYNVKNEMEKIYRSYKGEK